jgi:ACS family D-galactonate transporter-like MFS transporter
MLVKDSRSSWIAVAVLGLAIGIGYIDRVVLSVAIPAISKEYNFGPEVSGMLLSAFSWSYFIALIPAGWLIDRFGAKAVLSFGYVLWSIACAMTGLATSLPMLLVCRVLLGLGEAPLYPCGASLAEAGFSEHNRGLASAVYSEGAKIGPAMGAPLAAALLAFMGWREMFFWVGAGLIIWLPLWHFCVPNLESQRRGSRFTQDKADWLQIIKQRDILGMMLGNFGYLYAFWVYLTWLPSYLMQVRGFGLVNAGLFTSLPFTIFVVTSLISGFAADRLIRSGKSPTLIRKSFIGSGLLLATAIIPAVLVQSSEAAVALFCVSLAGMGISVPNSLAVPAGIAQAGRGAMAGSLSQLAGNFGGAIAPIITGVLLQHESFASAMILAGALLFVSLFGYLVVLRKIQPMKMERQGSSNAYDEQVVQVSP